MNGLAILMGLSCLAYVELASALLVWSNQTSQTGGQLYSDTSPYGETQLSFALLDPRLRAQERAGR